MTLSAPDPEDLTARARIRDAALWQFGEHGFERATIRRIADAAGVSSGLVRHHFGSTQALRQACDGYLSRVISDLTAQARWDPTLREVHHVAATQAALGPYQRYLARALAEGAAGSLFDQMVRMTQEWLAAADQTRPDPPVVDPRSRATVITAMALSVSVLHQHVARGLPAPIPPRPTGPRSPR